MDLTFWLELALFVILLGFSGFFSSSETSLFSLNQLDLEQMRSAKDPKLDLIKRLLSEPRRLIVTILIGNEFVNVAASVLSAAMVIALFGAENKMINLFIMVPILLLVGEITPKTLAIRNNRAFASYQSGPIDFFARLITPIRWLVRTVAEWFITLIVGRERSRGNIITEDMVRTLAHEAVGEGVLDQLEAQYIDQIFDFGSKTLHDVMTPRSDIHFLSEDAPLTEVVQELKTSKQTRFPVYREHRDTVLGILHARDLLGMDLERLREDPDALVNLLREPSFFPESKLALELFHTFRERKQSFGLVVDEYGGVTGLVTMEDLLECVFGDIRSPSDIAYRDLVKELGEGRFLVDPVIALEDFNQKFSTLFEFEQAETLAGVLLHEFGELPGEGSRIDIEEYRFSVQGVAANRITKVLVERLPVGTPAAEAEHAVRSEAAEGKPEPAERSEAAEEQPEQAVQSEAATDQPEQGVAAVAVDVKPEQDAPGKEG